MNLTIDVVCQDLAGTEDIFLFKMLAEKNEHRRSRAETNEKLDDIYRGETPARTKENQANPFQTTPLYAFQIRRRASVIPTSLVSNSYRPTAVVRVKARRNQLQNELNLGTRHGRK